MSCEDAENSLRSKLMGIIEEELLALNLREEKKGDENGCLDILIERKVDDSEKETFSSAPGNKAAEKMLESGTQNEVECECENQNPLIKNVIVENERESNYQHPEPECIHKSEEFNATSKTEAENKLQSTYNRNNLSEEIVRQVEFYFQDYNILKNSYLLNRVRRSKNGYISLKLVSSLPKVKSLTRDYRVVAYSLKNSKFLELNSEGNKVRRINPVPRIEDTGFGKTVMVFNLPQQNLTKDYLKELFSKYGSIVFVGVFENKYPNNDVYHERCLNFHRKIASKIYGIVEFERYSQVVKALKDDGGYLPKDNDLKVIPLMPQIYQKEKKYIKCIDVYDAYPKERYGRFYPRNGSHFAQNETQTSRRGNLKNRNVSVSGYINRGNFRRGYRGRRYFVSQIANRLSDGPISDDYKGAKGNNSNNNGRQLEGNGHPAYFYPNMYPRKNGCERYIESKTSV